MDGANERQSDDQLVTPDENTEVAKRSLMSAPRAALALFVALEIVAFPLLLAWGRGGGFNRDDWDFLALRKIGDFGDLMRPHLGHWTTLPVIAYRLLWSLVGLRTYTPYLMLAITAHLAVAALLRAVMRRAGSGPWWSTLAATVLLFFGSGAENALVAFQITFLGALAFGLSQLLLADHHGSLDKRDWLALVMGFAGLMCSGVELVMVVVVGLVVFSRRGWRLAAFHTAPLAVAYGIWTLTAPKGQSVAKFKATSTSDAFKFVGVGLKAAFVSLGEVSGVGLLLGLLLVVGLVLTLRSQGRRILRGSAAVPLSLLVGAIVFLFLTAAFRSNQLGPHIRPSGPDRARLSRYVYIVSALALPAIAFALETISRQRRLLTVAVAALLAIGLPGNISKFADYMHQPSYIPTIQRSLLASAEIPLANQLPRSLQPEPLYARGVTLGWLLDSRRDHRFPAHEILRRGEIATALLKLALRPSPTEPSTSCRTLVKPTKLILRKADRLTASTESVTIYLRLIGGHSLPRRLAASKSVVALAGPLRLLLVPPTNLGNGLATICT